jgi:hypothetical protein
MGDDASAFSLNLHLMHSVSHGVRLEMIYPQFHF